MNELQKITFFKNKITQYEVLHHFREALTWSFENLGIKTDTLDIATLDPSMRLKALYSNPSDCTFAFNGLQPSSNGTFFCDEVEIPHISWLVDSADYFHEMAKGSFNFLITPDKQSEILLKGWGAPHAHFLPHAFDERLASPLQDKKKFPLVFTGSLIDPIEIEELWKTHLPDPIQKDLIHGADTTLKSPDLTYQTVYQNIIRSHPAFFLTLTTPQISDLATTFDRYIRAKDRIFLLQNLNGLPVHIFGNCLSKRTWGDFLNLSAGNYVIHPAVDFAETINIMKNAQIILNSSPMFKTGAHERIFYGLGLGSLVLTNETPWTKTHFSENELLTYRHTNQNLSEMIKESLNNPQKLKDMAEKGQKKVLQEHTWTTRAKHLIQAFNKASFD